MPLMLEPVVDIARRIQFRADGGYAWFVLMPSGDPGENALTDVKDELEVVLAANIRVVTAGTVPIHDFIAAINRSSEDVVLVAGLDEWTDEHWIAFDIQRSSLERKGAVVLFLSAPSVLRLSNHAPNIRSFVGGSIFQLAPGGGLFSESDRRLRIKELEDYYGATSDEVVARATQRNLDPDPNFVEWLVLLGRGDLV